MDFNFAAFLTYRDSQFFFGKILTPLLTYILLKLAGGILKIQWCSIENQQSPVYGMKWGHFDRVNSTLKMQLSSWNFDTVFKKVRSFDAEKLGPVG